MAAPRTRMRRRQRSVRLTVAIGLLSVATAVVLASLPTQSPLWLSVASVTSLVLGWTAVRITWSEVLQTRRENVADRAAAAAAYKSLFSARAAEHAELTTEMTERLAESHLSQRELEGLLTQHETRAQRAESRLAEAQERVRVLEDSIAVLRGESADPVVDPLVDLVSWDEQATQKAAQNAAQKAGQQNPVTQVALKRA